MDKSASPPGREKSKKQPIMPLSAPRPSRHSRWAHVIRVRFFWLLAGLIGFILVAPELPNNVDGEWEALMMVIGIFFAATYVSQGLDRFWAIGLMCLLLTIVAGIYIFANQSAMLESFLLLALLITLLYTSICVLSFVLGDGQVGLEHIYGAICAYVLIAMAFATLYLMLDIVHHGSFAGVHHVTIGDRPWWQFFYFSFSTLSTVGYGDIVPITMRARSFVMIEQMTAIFYVAILISRLTGMYTSTRRVKTEIDVQPPTT